MFGNSAVRNHLVHTATLRLTAIFAALLAIVPMNAALADEQRLACSEKQHIYFTKGVHNPCDCDKKNNHCVETRAATEPPDPSYPGYWISEWTMYRVFNNYAANLPPWNSPPGGLVRDVDYEQSWGATWYDNTYVAADGTTGAMMEHYERRCLPIFPMSNKFTCSFISLGNTAWFLTYQKDRPAGMPPCCLFSPYNHPPRQDFIKHLPYSAEDSEHLNGRLQAYRYIARGNIWFLPTHSTKTSG